MSRVYRIGQIVPSSNVTMETEIPAIFRMRESLFPERFTFHSSRMRMKKVTQDELAAMDADSDRCALELSDAAVDVMGYACLVAIMAMGRGDPVPRFTFHMTLDTAVDWRVGTLWGESWFLNARLTNLLNSGTELLEELRTGDNFRKSLEMVPTRALWLTLRVES